MVYLLLVRPGLSGTVRLSGGGAGFERQIENNSSPALLACPSVGQGGTEDLPAMLRIALQAGAEI